DMGAGDRDGRPHVVAAREVIAEDLAHEVPPRIERYDLFGIAPLRVRSDALDRRGIREVRDVIVGERSRRDGERAIDRIAAGVASDRVAMVRVAQGRDHRSAFGRGGRAPDEVRPLRHALVRRPVYGTQQTRVHDRPLGTSDAGFMTHATDVDVTPLTRNLSQGLGREKTYRIIETRFARKLVSQWVVAQQFAGSVLRDSSRPSPRRVPRSGNPAGVLDSRWSSPARKREFCSAAGAVSPKPRHDL